jgi:hypothetical protein
MDRRLIDAPFEGRVSKMMMLKIQVMNVQFDDRIVHHFAL